MPALRQSLTLRRHWILVVAVVVLAAATICDWTRPPRQQISVALYERIVIGGYRVVLKPLSGRFVHCRFQPTCSRYSEEAMLAHGFPKGLWLTTARLFRCMPWVPLGTRDPVPDR
jgi:putative membrane protein insertion efficiency factor